MPEAKRGAPRKAGPTKMVYWPNCVVCNFMQANPAFKARLMQCSYFDPNGIESLPTVLHDWAEPFTAQTCYRHIERHQPEDRVKALIRFKEDEIDRRGQSPWKGKSPKYRGPRVPTATPLDAKELLEGEIVPEGNHERVLDSFIAKAEEKMKSGAMAITATNMLNAIKIKADIQKSAKDRRMDMIKSFFIGGGQKNETEN